MANEHRRSTIPTLKAAIAAATKAKVDLFIKVDKVGNMEIAMGGKPAPADDLDRELQEFEASHAGAA